MSAGRLHAIVFSSGVSASGLAWHWRWPIRCCRVGFSQVGPRWHFDRLLAGRGCRDPRQERVHGQQLLHHLPKKGVCVCFWAVVPKGVAFVQCVQSSIWLFCLEQKSVQWATLGLISIQITFIGISVLQKSQLWTPGILSLTVRCISHTNNPVFAGCYVFSGC